SPARLDAAAGGDLILAGAHRKRLHKYFEPALRFIGGVSHPTESRDSGRELALCAGVLIVQIRRRLALGWIQRIFDCPQCPFLASTHVHEEASIRRPVRGAL